MRIVFAVLLANELDQFRVEHDPLVNRDGPRLGVGLGIVDGDLDFQMSEIRTPETLDDPAGLGQRAALYIQPAHIFEVRRLDGERLAFPVASRVAEPPRL